MHFRPEEVAAFLQVFEGSKQQIRHFPGCLHLELHRDAEDSSVYYTYSQWESPDDLEAYRASDLFKKTWAATKVLFAGRPMAFSLSLQQRIDK